MTREVSPGRPSPLGAVWDGSGTTFAVHSSTAERVDLCLLHDSADGTAEERVELTESTHHVWHAHLPGVGPGQRYGYRVDGPWDPSRGLWHNPSKLLLDPYARAVTGRLDLVPAVFAATPEGHAQLQDSAAHVPHGVVVHDAFPWGEDRRPQTPWSDTVVYELHVKGFTAQHPGVPEHLRGTYAGLAHPAAVEHLLRLGVTAVELLPVHQHVTEPHLVRKGLTNYWGYNTLGYFAPHGAYSASGTRGEQVAEFKAMVRALHQAGLEVILDVVYNHTAEGGHDGPMLSLRGFDNDAYYRLSPADPSKYWDSTGCGNTVDLREPAALRLVLDSLRYWVTEMRVDGFRFDLATALARGSDDFDSRSVFLQAVQQDPVLREVKLIAEPWDVGSGGYQVGAFPPPWSEWNGQYRDTVRDLWRGHGGVRALAYRLSGSSDLYQGGGRRPYASVNFVTSHDGFTLRDLTSYDHKHNEANGEDGRDGDDHNRSWSCGVEGETDDPGINALRRRQARNLLATLLLSTGVPMLSMGDEVRRTQRGNNNAYCHDSALTWQPWEGLDESALDMRAWVERLVAVRRAHPVLRQRAFFVGRPVGDEDVKDLAWFTAHGTELTDAEWFDPSVRTLGMYLDGRAVRTGGRHGHDVVDDSLLLVVHGGSAAARFALPPRPWATGYDVLLDTRDERPGSGRARTYRPGGRLPLEPRSVVLLRAAR